MAILSPLADWVRSQPVLRRAAHTAVRLIPDVPYTMRVPQLGPVRIRLRRHRWYLWERFGQGDTLMLGIFSRMVRPGDVAYDIGANIGIYSRLMIQWFGAEQVVAFEPMRENFELLAENISLGKLNGRAMTFRAALSDVEGEEELQIDDMTSGTAVLDSVSGGEASDGRRAFGLPPRTERVKVVRLDEFITRHKLPAPTFMKVDTEGAEASVLEGAWQTLTRHKPRLAIAIHGPDKAQATLEALQRLDYFSYGFVSEPDSRHGGALWRRLRAIDSELLANNNIVASVVEEDVRAEILPQQGPRA